MKVINYIVNIFVAIFRLLQGMYITMLNFIRPKVTEQYPENREKKHPFEQMRGQLIMPHNENNQHKCTACLICMTNCPNGTIRITTKKEIDEETGKEKKVLDAYLYDLGSCTFCALCTWTCPQGAIEWSQNFEHAMFTRSKLDERLNREGSSLAPKSPKGDLAK
ncbi:MAG: 4Fe-4S binding protein [Candidatus Azobacteroides sp.]|nr:4Fe-4S binding protein [Candidatus Azobacteroides sp.]